MLVKESDVLTAPSHVGTVANLLTVGVPPTWSPQEPDSRGSRTHAFSMVTAAPTARVSEQPAAALLAKRNALTADAPLTTKVDVARGNGAVRTGVLDVGVIGIGITCFGVALVAWPRR